MLGGARSFVLELVRRGEKGCEVSGEGGGVMRNWMGKRREDHHRKALVDVK
jgi:hypothetical protein